MTDYDTVRIECDTFRAHIYLMALEAMTLANVRKLFRLAWIWQQDNQKAIDDIGAWLVQAIPAAEKEMLQGENKKTQQRGKARYNRLVKVRKAYAEMFLTDRRF